MNWKPEGPLKFCQRRAMCRVPCEYTHRNLSVRVEEKSRAPAELTIRFLYQGGQTDIVAVDVATVSSNSPGRSRQRLRAEGSEATLRFGGG